MEELKCRDDQGAPISGANIDNWNAVWGTGGKTAKMKAANECYHKNYYNAQIVDCGNWKFKAVCSGDIPNDWSRPISDEAARDHYGYPNRFAMANENCRVRGWVGADPMSVRDKGDWAFSYQCKRPTWANDWEKGKCNLRSDDVQARTRFYSRNVDLNGLDVNVAFDWFVGSTGYPKINDAIFGGVIKSVQQDRNARKVIIEVSDVNCQCQRDEDWKSVWGAGGKTAKMKLAQQCADANSYSFQVSDCEDPFYYKKQCNNVPIPNDWSRPISDEAAKDNVNESNQPFANRNDFAQWDCRRKGFADIDANNWKDMGNWLFSVKCTNPTFVGEWIDQGCNMNVENFANEPYYIEWLPLMQKYHEFHHAFKTPRLEHFVDVMNAVSTRKDRKFRRKINALTMKWETAGDFMLKTYRARIGQLIQDGIIDGILTNAVIEQDPTGVYLVLYVNMNNCDCKKDEDYGSVWGGGGKTAMLKLAQQCADTGNYTALITPCTNTFYGYKAICQGPPPESKWNTREWSKPISDEAARDNVDEFGKPFKDRNDFARWECRRKGFADIDENTWEDTGNWLFTVKCVNPTFLGDWVDQGCNMQTEQNTELFINEWQEVEYFKEPSTKLYMRKVDAGNLEWDAAADWMLQNDESIPKVGSEFQGSIVTKVYKKKFNIDDIMRGSFMSGVWIVVEVEDKNCNECVSDEILDSKWGSGGRTAKMHLRHNCAKKGFSDVIFSDCGNWGFKAQCTEPTPEGMSEPISDEVAQSLGFFNRNDYAKEDCKKKQYFGINRNEYKDYGDSFYSIQCESPDWKGEWIDEGCQSNDIIQSVSGSWNGMRRFARQIDAKSFNWEDASRYILDQVVSDLNDNKVLDIGNMKVEQKNVEIKVDKRVSGIFIVADVKTDLCKPGLSLMDKILIAIAGMILFLIIFYIIFTKMTSSKKDTRRE